MKFFSQRRKKKRKEQAYKIQIASLLILTLPMNNSDCYNVPGQMPTISFECFFCICWKNPKEETILYQILFFRSTNTIPVTSFDQYQICNNRRMSNQKMRQYKTRFIAPIDTYCKNSFFCHTRISSVLYRIAYQQYAQLGTILDRSLRSVCLQSFRKNEQINIQND